MITIPITADNIPDFNSVPRDLLIRLAHIGFCHAIQTRQVLVADDHQSALVPVDVAYFRLVDIPTKLYWGTLQ